MRKRTYDYRKAFPERAKIFPKEVMIHKSVSSCEELAEAYVVKVEWRGDDYGVRKGYYRDAFLAGIKEGKRIQSEIHTNNYDKMKSERDRYREALDFYAENLQHPLGEKARQALSPAPAKEPIERGGKCNHVWGFTSQNHNGEFFQDCKHCNTRRFE